MKIYTEENKDYCDLFRLIKSYNESNEQLKSRMLASIQFSFMSFVIMQRHPNNNPLFKEKCAKMNRMFQNKRRAAFLRRWLLENSRENLSLSLFFGDNDTFGYPGNLLVCAWVEVYGLAVAFENSHAMQKQIIRQVMTLFRGLSLSHVWNVTFQPN